MNSLHEPTAKALILQRLNKLNADQPRLWGTMDVAQMLAHCTAQIEIGMGKVKVRTMGPQPLLWLIKQTVGLRLKWKRDLPTAREMTMSDRREFEKEREKLIATLAAFVENGKWSPHPIFGTMSKDDWGKVAYKHLDHHLRQFGV